MKARLPDPLELSCPACNFRLKLTPAAVQELADLVCPKCAATNATYYWLPANLRQQLSARIRSRLYFEAHRRSSG
jgi:hypothetical protein